MEGPSAPGNGREGKMTGLRLDNHVHLWSVVWISAGEEGGRLGAHDGLDRAGQACAA